MGNTATEVHWELNTCNVRCEMQMYTSAAVTITVHQHFRMLHGIAWPWSKMLMFNVVCLCVCVFVCVQGGNRDRDIYGWTGSQRIRETEREGNETVYVCPWSMWPGAAREFFPGVQQLINQPRSSIVHLALILLRRHLYCSSSPSAFLLSSPSPLHSAEWDIDGSARRKAIDQGGTNVIAW